MAGVNLQIIGLKEIAERFSTQSINKKLAPAISLYAKGLNAVIGKSVVDTYTVSTTDFNKITSGVQSSNLKTGLNIIEQGLVYNFKARRLVEFPHIQTVISSAPNRFLVRRGELKYGLRWKYYSTATLVRVKRSDGYQTVVGKRGYGGFYQKRNSGGVDRYSELSKPVNRNSNIFERLSDQTWNKEPEDRRGTLQVLFGPSISQMVNKVIETDNKVKDKMNSYAEEIGRNIKW